jgi:hypothetical protein
MVNFKGSDTARVLLRFSHLVAHHSVYSQDVLKFCQENAVVLREIQSILNHYVPKKESKPFVDYAPPSRRSYNDDFSDRAYFSLDERDRRDKEMERIEDSRGVCRWG